MVLKILTSGRLLAHFCLGSSFDALCLPRRNVVKIVGLNRTVRKDVDPSHDISPRDQGVTRPFDLADVRLRTAELQGQPALCASCLRRSPSRELHSFRSRIDRYSHSLYLKQVHKQSSGENYKYMAYVLVMRPKTRLRELRKATGMSQVELARRTGVSQPAISQVENDQKPMDINEMRAFARIFGVQPADLLSDDDNPDRLSEEERQLLERFREADEQQRALIARVAEPVQGFRARDAA